MYTLYTLQSSAGMAPHILLREIGAEHRLVVLDREAEDHHKPEYLKLNPNARVPTLLEGDQVIYESAAIVLHLVDRHPEAGLAPALGTAERAQFYKWLVWMTNTVQADMLLYFCPERYVPAVDAPALRKVTEARVHLMFQQLDGELATRPWLVGDGYTAADAYLFMLARWTRNMTLKARDLPHLGPYLAKILERPAVRSMFEIEGIGEPYY